ncbi:hypothetical protein [Desulfonatronovibrio hydrogenovorans]|uniref:hypothetical protein n=1 Tax=Desulfonatronovibrio hydrogenovorans TaxID=53245 RepID=UPI00068A3DB4|nr:hypothetical protein [Desulfonatronovibrio hydrogenovorans]
MKKVICLMILAVALGTMGCGKKVWPEPDADQEKFNLAIIDYKADSTCLEITAQLTGNHRNLARVVLELEASDVPCPTCPFLITDSVYLEPGSPAMDRSENRVNITHCGLDPDKHYRARLRAGNVYPAIRETLSGVITIVR